MQAALVSGYSETGRDELPRYERGSKGRETLIHANYAFALAAGIGIVAGLRSLTAPALVSWAAHLGWLNLHGSPLAFMESAAAVAIFSLLAIAEYVGDVLPKTPSRTAPGPLIARIVMGGLSGACLCASANQSLLAGSVLGGIGGVIGAFSGYEARKRLVNGLKVKDVLIAIPEDMVAIGLAYFLVSPR
jgi:uncharacterized membrane protein